MWFLSFRRIFPLPQWHTRWGGPETSDWEISVDSCWEKRGKEKMEKEAEKKENRKREGVKLKMEGGKVRKWREDFFFFFFFAVHFSKPLTFILGLPKWEFSTGKKHFMPGKKSGKMTLHPLKNIPLTPLPSLYVLLCYSKLFPPNVASSLPAF